MPVVDYQQLQLAARGRAWNVDEAEQRLLEHLEGALADGDDVQRRFRQAFLWYDDEQTAERSGYRLPIADVIDGELRAVPRAIFAAARALVDNGGAELNAVDDAGARAHLDLYYRRMADEFGDRSLVAPWAVERRDGDPKPSRSGRPPQPNVERRDMRGDELRVLPAHLEVRAADEGADSPGTLVWYPAVYNVLSEPLLGFREKVAPGAFDKTCREHDIRSLLNHDDNYVFGRSRPERKLDSTLQLFPDDQHGLRAENPLPDTQAARDLVVSIERGDVDQGSFGFRTVRDEWDYSGDQLTEDDLTDDDLLFGAGGVVRTLLEVRLFDVSIVTFPAYPQTTAEVRSQALQVARAHRGSSDHRTRLARLALGDLTAREPA